MILLPMFVSILLIQSICCKEFCEQKTFDSIINLDFDVNNTNAKYRFNKEVNQTVYGFWEINSFPKSYIQRNKLYSEKFRNYLMPYQSIKIESIPHCLSNKTECNDVMKLNQTYIFIFISNNSIYTLDPNNDNSFISSLFIDIITRQSVEYKPLVYWPKNYYFFGIINDNRKKAILKLEIKAFDNELKLSNSFRHEFYGFDNMFFTLAFVWLKSNTIHVVVEDKDIPESERYGYIYEYNETDMTFIPTNKTIVQFFGCKIDPNQSQYKTTEKQVLSTVTELETTFHFTVENLETEKTNEILIVFLVIFFIILVLIGIWIGFYLKIRANKAQELRSEKIFINEY